MINKRVAITTLGCKLNQYDSEMVLAQFRSAGYEVVGDFDDADLCIINTCSVTATAERKVRNTLRSAHRINPKAKLLVIGCMAERTPETLSEFPGVIGVAGNSEKERIVEIAESYCETSAPVVEIGGVHEAAKWTDQVQLDGLLGRTRSFLKVQDGCSQFCTYCIVPKLRGRGRSQPISDAVDHAQRLIDLGHKEIVLTGCALGTYGFDFDTKDGLARLIEQLDSIPGNHRFRLGSVEPWAITLDFLRIIAESERICPHLHIPLQSCDDSVLRRMNRRYSVDDIRRALDFAYSIRDDWGFGSDIIVGFPGETDEHFKNTVAFLRESRLSYLHIFPFSERPGTPAGKLPDSISPQVKQIRLKQLAALDIELRLRFRKQHLGRTCQVLYENRYVNGMLAGHAENYLDVYVAPTPDLIGQIVETEITKLLPDGVEGVIPERKDL